MRWVGMSAVGFVLYAVAWYLASEQAGSAAQMGPVNLGVAGLAVFGAANTMWLMRGHRAVRIRARAIVSSSFGDPRVEEQSGTADPLLNGAPDDVVVAGAGLHYHRIDCPMAQGRGWSERTRVEVVAGGKHPCGICRP